MGIQKKEINPDSILLIPIGLPRYPDGIFGRNMHEKFIRKFSPYRGLTNIVEIRREGDLIGIYGPLVTIKKIYEEIS